MNILRVFKYINKIFSDFIEINNFFRQTPYLLEEINTETEQVTIHCRGSRAYIKTTIEGAIIAPNIIKGIPSMHACWIGYYYTCNPKISRKHQGLGFEPQTIKGRFKIISLETRTSMLTYFDKKTNLTHKEKITNIVQDQFFINNIDPTQACYIGMQAGYIIAKHGYQISYSPTLKLVK